MEAAFIVFDVYEVMTMMTVMMSIVDDTCSPVFLMREKKSSKFWLFHFNLGQLFGESDKQACNFITF